MRSQLSQDLAAIVVLASTLIYGIFFFLRLRKDPFHFYEHPQRTVAVIAVLQEGQWESPGLQF